MNFELEQALNLNYENEVEFNLSTAQKYLTKLKSHQKSLNSTSSRSRNHSYDLWEVTQSHVDTSEIAKIHNLENFKINTNAAVEKIQNSRTDVRSISYDIINIKNEVHKKNSSVGIDIVLSSIDFLNAELSDWKSMEKTCDKFTPYTDAHLLKIAFDLAKDESNNGKTPMIPSMCVSIYPPNVIATKIKIITEAINKLEEQRDTLNVNTKIKIKISDKAKKVLGL